MPNGLRLMVDTEDVIRSFNPEWTRATGQPARARLRVRQPGRGRRAVRAGRRRRLRRREGAVGRVLGPPLRAARATPTACRSTCSQRSEPRRGGRRARARPAALEILRPPSADELIDEAAFDEEEFLPYWAELWPSGLALARHVGGTRARRAAGARARLRARAALARRGAARRATCWPPTGRRTRSSCCGGTPSATASCCASRASAGASRIHCSAPRPGTSSSAPTCSTRRATPSSSPSFCQQLGGEVLLAEPGRPYAKEFLERFQAEPVGERIYRLAC